MEIDAIMIPLYLLPFLTVMVGLHFLIFKPMLKMLQERERAIEDDRLEDLPGDVFVRGFIKAYARCVGVNPSVVLHRLAALEPSSLPIVATSTGGLHRRRVLSLVLLLAAAVVAFVLLRPALVSEDLWPVVDAAQRW